MGLPEFAGAPQRRIGGYVKLPSSSYFNFFLSLMY